MQSPRVESKRSVGALSPRWRPVLQPLVQRAAILSPAGRAVSFSPFSDLLRLSTFVYFC